MFWRVSRGTDLSHGDTALAGSLKAVDHIRREMRKPCRRRRIHGQRARPLPLDLLCSRSATSRRSARSPQFAERRSALSRADRAASLSLPRGSGTGGVVRLIESVASPWWGHSPLASWASALTLAERAPLTSTWRPRARTSAVSRGNGPQVTRVAIDPICREIFGGSLRPCPAVATRSATENRGVAGSIPALAICRLRRIARLRHRPARVHNTRRLPLPVPGGRLARQYGEAFALAIPA
jgi:hypothetical protein